MIRHLSSLLIMAALFAIAGHTYGQNATVSEEYIGMKTYMFSDPDPVPAPSRIYPYFYFSGYTNRPEMKDWKMVVLENEYIKVFVCPDIGGKVWGAVEKSTGNEFLYFNNVVKFRDVAMRGAWTSGGLEYNFGDIGHIPTCATPVDYFTSENPDGSVSCTIGAIDLPSETRWNIEIILRPDEAFFETRTTWYNNTSLPVTYYHWMNAAAKASGNLEFIYPGSSYIGHGGEAGEWPVKDGRNLSFYENNNFGTYKSYHVINSYSDYFGGYWHDDDFGFGHLSNYDEKPGKKLWIWGLSRQGMIWEQLLTDDDGQYIEFQAGKLFNQAAESSTFTPFKHREFSPHDADRMDEIWFPLKGTEGMVAASRYGVLNIEKETAGTRIILGALKSLDDELSVDVDGTRILTERIKLNPLEKFEKQLDIKPGSVVEIILGDRKLVYSSEGTLVDRPVEPNPDFDWTTAYGIFIKSLELEKQRRYPEALDSYLSVLEKEPGFLPALNRTALGYYRKMQYSVALDYILKALGIDTYDGEANYLLGLVSSRLGDINRAKSGFSIAMGSTAYRSAAATELAKLYLIEKDYRKAVHYGEEALKFNRNNLDALQTIALAFRKSGEIDRASIVLDEIESEVRSSHFARFEAYMISQEQETLEAFTSSVTNELPYQSYLDLAIGYYNRGLIEEAVTVLKLSPVNPVSEMWLAILDSDATDMHLSNAISEDPAFVFPYRTETAGVIEKLIENETHWKLKYYLALIYWNLGIEERAMELFKACGDEPDFAPFYLARATFADGPEDKLFSLKRAVELAPGDWRASLALAKEQLARGQANIAYKTISPFVKLFPEQSAIGVCYAEVLNAMGLYGKSLEFLDKYEVLPFEGATITRDLYYNAAINAAMLEIKNNKPARAIKLVEKSKLWPENLGAGRPYDVDERLSDYLLGYLYSKTGRTNLAQEAYKRVADYKQPEGLEENSGLLLQLLVLESSGRKAEADSLLDYYTTRYPGNSHIRWAGLFYNKQYESARQLQAQIEGSENKTGPYDTGFTDKGFAILVPVLEKIGY